MKRRYKGLVAAVLLVAVVLSNVVTSYAAAVVADAIMGDISSDVLKWCLMLRNFWRKSGVLRSILSMALRMVSAFRSGSLTMIS